MRTIWAERGWNSKIYSDSEEKGLGVHCVTEQDITNGMVIFTEMVSFGYLQTYCIRQEPVIQKRAQNEILKEEFRDITLESSMLKLHNVFYTDTGILRTSKNIEHTQRLQI